MITEEEFLILASRFEVHNTTLNPAAFGTSFVKIGVTVKAEQRLNEMAFET